MLVIFHIFLSEIKYVMRQCLEIKLKIILEKGKVSERREDGGCETGGKLRKF